MKIKIAKTAFELKATIQCQFGTYYAINIDYNDGNEVCFWGVKASLSHPLPLQANYSRATYFSISSPYVIAFHNMSLSKGG